jgi:RimJ/RimL family protein N-acetyltransferase
VILRRALLDDCYDVWQWNFAPDVRELSRDPRVVTFVEHARWYEQRLARGEPMWIIEDRGVGCGVVRIDLLAHGSSAFGSSGAAGRFAGLGEYGRISIALAAGARGRGLGQRAIREACAAWGGPVVAEIRIDNEASQACFEACGFAMRAVAGNLITYHWSP